MSHVNKDHHSLQTTFSVAQPVSKAERYIKVQDKLEIAF